MQKIPAYFADGLPKLTSINIPNSVTSIGASAFRGCYLLTSIDIPNSITEIADNTFRACSGLTSVTIPNTVTFIGDSAFYYCYGLTNLDIPNSVTSIGEYAFCNCSGLESVTIGESVTSIGYDAFYLYGYGSNSKIKNLIWNAKNCNSKGSMITSNVENVTIGSKVELIPESFLYNSKITSVTIPNSVTTISNDAFRLCNNLSTVTIPSSVTYIGFAFYGCIGLNNVYSYITDPSSIWTDYYAFYRSPYNNEERTLYVPAGTLAAYQADSNWSDYFGNIVEMVHNGDANGDNVVSIKDVTDLIDYLLGGGSTSFNSYNADLNGDGEITIKDVTDLIDQLLGSE